MTTFEKTCQIILEFKGRKISPEMLKPTASLVEDLMLDSLDFSELLVLSEIAFELEIPIADMRNMKTLGDVAAYFDMLLSARANPAGHNK